MAVVPTINTVMIDCCDATGMASFWSDLLGVGVRHVEHGFIWLDPQREGGFSLAFQEVGKVTPGKNKLHLDASCGDLDGLTTRIETLGGRLVEQQRVQGFVWYVYADPEDNVFCAGHPAD
jgi:hypothetical protein